jgi:hypothetical protein
VGVVWCWCVGGVGGVGGGGGGGGGAGSFNNFAYARGRFVNREWTIGEKKSSLTKRKQLQNLSYISGNKSYV